MGAPFNAELGGQTSWDMNVLLADTARALHMRRMLKTAHAHGFAMLDALGLSPLALDILDDVIGAFDMLDGDPDFEDGDPREETSLETAGRGFVRCGADDDEDGFDIEEEHDAEQTYEDGSEDEPHPWRFQPDAWALVAGVHYG